MKIRCIANSGSFFPENYLDPKRGYTKDIQLPLTIGKEYVVYAFSERQEKIWYYICDDNEMYYPIRTPAPLFEIVDDRVSQYWRVKFYPNGLLRFAFKEWVNDDNFYDRLTDMEEEEVLIFERVKELMDAEAATPLPESDRVEKPQPIAAVS